jgi:hypothetical protein
MLKVILFDVNETLLNIHALQPELTSLLGEGISGREWFLEVLQHTLVMNEVKEYRPFSEVAEAVLQMMVGSQGRQLRPDLMEGGPKQTCLFAALCRREGYLAAAEGKWMATGNTDKFQRTQSGTAAKKCRIDGLF